MPPRNPKGGGTPATPGGGRTPPRQPKGGGTPAKGGAPKGGAPKSGSAGAPAKKSGGTPGTPSRGGGTPGRVGRDIPVGAGWRVKVTGSMALRRCAACGRELVTAGACPYCGNIARPDAGGSRSDTGGSTRPASARPAGTQGVPRRPTLPRQPGVRRPPASSAPPRRRSRPEISARLVQAVMLGLGALLLGVAGVVFVGAAITALQSWGPLTILLVVAAGALGTAPAMAKRNLTATAESISAVGIALLGASGYALWATGAPTGLGAPTFTGLWAAVTAAVAYTYHRFTALAVPRYGGSIALQLVLPMLAYPVVSGTVAWAAVFTAMAAHNGLIGRLDQRWGEVAGPAWHRYLGWVLHGVAVGVAVGFAGTALALADTVPEALPAGGVLILAVAVGLAGTLSLRRAPLPDVAAGLVTLAVMVSAARVAVLAAPPERAMMPVAAVVLGAAVASRLLPVRARRGPQWATAGVLAVAAAVATVFALRAGLSLVALPAWPTAPQDASPLTGPPDPQLGATLALLTTAAAVAMPPRIQREGLAVGVALTALAVPGSLGLSADLAAWLLVAVAAGLGMTGLTATTRRAAAVHVGAAAVVGLLAAAVALAGPVLTATVLAGLAVSAAVVATAPARKAAATVRFWAGAGGVLAVPGATATVVAAVGGSDRAVLVGAYAGLAVGLGYVVAQLLVRRVLAVPVVVSGGVAALVVAVVTAAATAGSGIELAISALYVVTAAMVYFAPQIDDWLRNDWPVDAADLAAAAVTTATVATLARIAWLALPLSGPDSALVVCAALLLLCAPLVRRLSRRWRRGPVLGLSLAGAVAGGIAFGAVATTVVRIFRTLWIDGVTQWPPPLSVGGLSWGPTVAFSLLAVAAAVVLPRPRLGRRPGAWHASTALGVLATLAAPMALAVPWWGPAAVAAAVGTGYALASVGGGRWRPVGPRAARARAAAAAALGLYAVGAALPRPGVAAAVLALTVVVAATVATLVATLPGLEADPRLVVGGPAVTGLLFAAPGMLAMLAAALGRPAPVIAGAALAACGLGLAVAAGLYRWIRPYSPYVTVGVAASGGVVALGSLADPAVPVGVYAAAAVLLSVLAELLRAGPVAPAGAAGSAAADGVRRPSPTGRRVRRPPGWVSPPMGALIASAVPVLLALWAIYPALRSALVDPYLVLEAPWQGAPPRLLVTGHVPPTSVLAALLLTLAAALAAAGFGGAVTRQTAVVVAPGLAVTLLISPAALGAPWPASTAAALLVFTLSMLGVALTPPPGPAPSVRVLRWARHMVLAIGLAGGGAGLAGALADPNLTLATFAGAIAVGATAALGGHTWLARLLGWSGAAVAAQATAVTAALVAEAPRHRFGLYLLPVAAVALLLVTRLPQVRKPGRRAELVTVEWLGGYVSLAAGLAFAYGSATDAAVTLVGTGLVLGITAMRADRTDWWRRGLLWAGATCEVGAVWIVVWQHRVTVLEAYTLPLAAMLLVVGALELLRRPDLSSWIRYGPGLVAALVPSLVAAVLSGGLEPLRHGWVLAGGVLAVILGSWRRQRAPVVIGAAVAAAGALHLLSLGGLLLVLIPLGILLLVLGGSTERRQRDLRRIRGALDRMR